MMGYIVLTELQWEVIKEIIYQLDLESLSSKSYEDLPDRVRKSIVNNNLTDMDLTQILAFLKP